ncbi:MAG: hypothetical protein AAF581_03275 [Planctomycetota bacterium]
MTPRLLLAIVFCSTLTGCLATLEGNVESATTLILDAIPAPPGVNETPVQQIAVVGTTGETSLGHLSTVCEVADGTVVNHPNFDGVSPRLVRDVLRHLEQRPDQLYASRGRDALLFALEEEGQCPDYLLYIQISRLQKSGPGVGPSEYKVTMELVDVATGNRVAKETTSVSMSKYR